MGFLISVTLFFSIKITKKLGFKLTTLIEGAVIYVSVFISSFMPSFEWFFIFYTIPFGLMIGLLLQIPIYINCKNFPQNKGFITCTYLYL